MSTLLFLRRTTQMEKLRRWWLGVFVSVCCLGASPVWAKEPAAHSRPATDLNAAKEIFDANCARCHGATGAGDGIDAQRMFPRPRKLSEGIFKFRTTASGSPPTDEDLFHTLSTGLPGSRMPDFQRLPENARWQLVDYVKSLSPVFKDQKPEPVAIGTDPGPQRANLKKGKEVYTQLGCAQCHGAQGRGDGPSAPTLVDNWGNQIRAADLTHGWAYRGGSTPKEITTRFMTGIDGTPMPSYADAISSKEDAWQLAYYVQSLQETPQWRRIVHALKQAGDMPMNLEDPLWQKAPRTDLRLSSILYKEGRIIPTTVNAISVEALYNEKEIAFRFTWNDPSQTKTAPPDALILVLVPDRRQKFQIGSLRVWPASSDAPTLDVYRWAADGESASVGKELQVKSAYSEGQWKLLLRRSLTPVAAERVVFSPSKPALMGIVVWDGANGEQEKKRANSNWVDLILD